MDANDWEAIGQWVLIAFALFGAGLSIKRSRDSNKAAEAANQTSEDANEVSRQSVDAQERMATALERQIEALQARQNTAASQAPPGPPETAELHLQRIGGRMYRLRNVGLGTATNLRLEGLPQVNRWPEEAVTLKPLQSVDFLMVGAWGSPIPGDLEATWDEHPEPTIVPVPA